MIRQMPGPKARYRGKERQRVLTFALTPAGHAALAARLAATGLSRSDYLEGLIRDDVRRVMRPAHTEEPHAE
jgi:DNA-binding MarR family transcriptional regulator